MGGGRLLGLGSFLFVPVQAVGIHSSSYLSVTGWGFPCRGNRIRLRSPTKLDSRKRGASVVGLRIRTVLRIKTVNILRSEGIGGGILGERCGQRLATGEIGFGDQDNGEC